MVITGPTRNRLRALSLSVGSNPTLSARLEIRDLELEVRENNQVQK